MITKLLEGFRFIYSGANTPNAKVSEIHVSTNTVTASVAFTETQLSEIQILLNNVNNNNDDDADAKQF